MVDSLTDSEARIVCLEDERQILDTLYRYGHSIDYHLKQDWLDCFTEGATWETRRGPLAANGRAEERVRGRLELGPLFDGFGRPPDSWQKHMLVDSRIDIDGDRCGVHSYFLVVAGHSTGSHVKVFGRYRDRLVRCPDGRWRFEERICEIDGSHPLSEPGSGPDMSQSLAIEEIKRLKARSCHLLDAKRWTEWAQLFTEDAQLWSGPRQEDVVQGRPAIMARVSSAIAHVTTVHEAAMPDIEITGPTSAQGTWSAFSIVAANSDGTDSIEHRWGRHEDTYQRATDGHWRIQTLRITPLHAERS